MKKEDNMKKLFAVVCALGWLIAWAEVKYDNDIGYAAGERCRLDVKWPAHKSGFPTVVWFHGGGLTSGGKHFINIDSDIAQVAVNYRLLGKNGLTNGTECIRDAAAAVAWTLEHIAQYGGDPKKVYVSGMSAGGYLTMMVGMAPQFLKELGHDIRELAGLAPVSGQATKHFAVRQYAGDTDPQYLPKIDALAPLHYCSQDIPPIVSICGEEPWEWKCRSEENRLLISSCVALGHRNAAFVSCPFADHGRAYTAGVPYVEMFVNGRLPPSWMTVKERQDEQKNLEKGAKAMNDKTGTCRWGKAGGLKVLFLGNSITYHLPQLDVGWENTCGMSASAPERDYAHLVAAGLAERTGKPVEAIATSETVAFERGGYMTWDVERELAEFIAFQPDYVIIALGENGANNLGDVMREARYRDGLAKMSAAFKKGRAVPPVVVFRGIFWSGPYAGKEKLVRAAAERGGDRYVKIVDLYEDQSMCAYERYKNSSVGAHPGDKGMAEIASRILEALK